MFVNQMQDRFNPGTDLTARATHPVVGKTFAAYSAPMRSGNIAVATAPAGAATAGVVKYNADQNDLVGVARGAGRVVTVTAATNIEVGAALEVGEDGKATTHTTGVVVGWAVDAATAGADVLVSLAH